MPTEFCACADAVTVPKRNAATANRMAYCKPLAFVRAFSQAPPRNVPHFDPAPREAFIAAPQGQSWDELNPALPCAPGYANRNRGRFAVQQYFFPTRVYVYGEGSEKLLHVHAFQLRPIDQIDPAAVGIDIHRVEAVMRRLDGIVSELARQHGRCHHRSQRTEPQSFEISWHLQGIVPGIDSIRPRIRILQSSRDHCGRICKSFCVVPRFLSPYVQRRIVPSNHKARRARGVRGQIKIDANAVFVGHSILRAEGNLAIIVAEYDYVIGGFSRLAVLKPEL